MPVVRGHRGGGLMGRLPMSPGIRILDWLLSQGVEVRSANEIAADPVCRCIEDYCFHSGIIGPLDKDQEETYCKQTEPFPSPLLERVQKFLAARQTCPYEPEDPPGIVSLEADVRCLYRALEQDGLALR